MMERNLLHKTLPSVGEWIKYHFLVKKMNTPVGAILLGCLVIVLTYVTVLVDYKISMVIVTTLGVLLLVILCILNPVFGFYFSYFISMFISLPDRLLNIGVIPTGLIPEFFSYLTLIGVITKQQYRKEIDNKFWTNAISVWMLLLIGYYIIEILNPSMGSKLGWFNFFRKQISYFAFFYVSYCVLNSRKTINWFTNFWIGLSAFEALYACKQQWFGLFNFEQQWLINDPKRYELFVNWGFIRKFGLLSDPAASGMLYASCGTLILVLALRTEQAKKRILYYLVAGCNLLASTYSGTRTATLMIVGGVGFYCLLSLYERRTIIFTTLFTVLLIGILAAPIYENLVILRFRSAFSVSEDPSALVRDFNRKAVQPYIYVHPAGGGIFTSGQMGALYNPGHYLSNFPPDSGYLQILMELGPIGLLLTLIFYYVILRTGIKYFYRVKDPTIKSLYAANLVFIFSMFVAQFSQQAVSPIGLYPNVFYFYSALALLLKLHYYDSDKAEFSEQT